MDAIGDERENLVERIRSAVLSLELVPGQRLSERGLEPRFGASRTPIRAALMRLESERLVRREGKAWQVTPLDADELRGLYEFREIVEGAAVRLAVRRADPHELRALAAIANSSAEDDNPEHTLRTGTDFHREVARLSGNAELLGAVDGALTRVYRTRWLEVQTHGSRDRARHEHSAIAKALASGDSVGAERAMVEHVAGTGSRMLLALESSRQGRLAAGTTVV